MSEFSLQHPWMVFVLGICVLIMVYDSITNICNALKKRGRRDE